MKKLEQEMNLVKEVGIGVKHISFIMDMTQSFLDGEMDSINYYLDFPDELEMRYRKMVRENRDIAELIFDCLVEEGTDQYQKLSDAQFRKRNPKQYNYVKGVL